MNTGRGGGGLVEAREIWVRFKRLLLVINYEVIGGKGVEYLARAIKGCAPQLLKPLSKFASCLCSIPFALVVSLVTIGVNTTLTNTDEHEHGHDFP